MRACITLLILLCRSCLFNAGTHEGRFDARVENGAISSCWELRKDSARQRDGWYLCGYLKVCGGNCLKGKVSIRASTALYFFSPGRVSVSVQWLRLLSLF